MNGDNLNAINIAGALLPVFVILWYVRRRDQFPEPPNVVWTTFALGILTLVPLIGLFVVIGFSLSAHADPFRYALAAAFLEAALPEELLKFLVLYFYAFRHAAFDEPMDGIVYGVAASLGFAAIENVLYVIEGGFATAVGRALTAVPSHALDGVIMGFYLGMARAIPRRHGAFVLKALAVPVLLHGLYNFPLMLIDPAQMEMRGALWVLDYPWELIAVAVLAIEIILAVRLHGRLVRMQTRIVDRRARYEGPWS